MPSFFLLLFSRHNHIVYTVSITYNFFWSIPEFCVKRCILRTIIVCLMVFIGETIPKFSSILALVGGSTVTLATFVLPPFLYMKICNQTGKWVLSFSCLKFYLFEFIIDVYSFQTSSFVWESILVGTYFGWRCWWSSFIIQRCRDDSERFAIETVLLVLFLNYFLVVVTGT